MRDLDPRYRPGIEALLRAEGLDRLDDLMHVPSFDEVPLYSRETELSFMDDLPPLAQNKILIDAAAWYLAAILRHAESRSDDGDPDFYCMVSILDWDEYDSGGLVTPTFWCTNPSHGVLEKIRIDPPNSVYAAFVADTLHHDPDYVLGEGKRSLPGGPYTERVYIQLATHTAARVAEAFRR